MLLHLLVIALALVVGYIALLISLRVKINALPRPIFWWEHVRDRVISTAQGIGLPELIHFYNIVQKATRDQVLPDNFIKRLLLCREICKDSHSSKVLKKLFPPTKRELLVDQYNWWVTPLWLFGLVELIS